MKTTLNLNPTLMKRVKQEAARRGCTMTELVEDAVRALLDRRKQPPAKLPPLPVRHSGGYLIDVADRDALYDIFDKDNEAPCS